MKLYTVYEDSIEVLKTTDRLKVLEKLYKLCKKYEEKQSWFGVFEEELQ